MAILGTMRFVSILVLFLAFRYSANGEEIVLHQNEGFFTLSPTIGTGWITTEYVIKPAEEGSKIVAFCDIYIRNCKFNLLTIETGDESSTYCGSRVARKTWNTSEAGSIKITFKQNLQREGSNCKVAATKPYLNVEEEDIDSSEHGLRLPEGNGREMSCDCGWANKEDSRIIGGRLTGENEFPFIAALTHEEVGIYCGGSIITPHHVLSAAHCFDDIYDFEFNINTVSVKLGEHDINTETDYEMTIGLSKIDKHENYRQGPLINDIALLLLEQSIPTGNDHIGPVCMPTAPVVPREYVKAMGWGINEMERRSDILRKVNLRVIKFDVCGRIYPQATKKQLCTYSERVDSCEGDSGGPLVKLDTDTNRFVQVGLVSYGRECASTDPAVSTDVFAYMDWIQEKIDESDTGAVMCSKI